MTSPVHQRRLKLIEFDFGTPPGGTPLVGFECQISNWQLENNTEDGDKRYTFCPDGEFREETEDDYALTLTFFADWRSAGISNFMWLHQGKEVNFTINHHPDIPLEHVRWTGKVKMRAPSVGGEARTTEEQEVTLQVIGTPVYTPNDEIESS